MCPAKRRPFSLLKLPPRLILLPAPATGSATERYIDEMHVFVLSASTLEATTGTLVTLLSALLSTTQCRSELNITQPGRASEWPDPNHAYHCYAGHGYFADTRFLAKHTILTRALYSTPGESTTGLPPCTNVTIFVNHSCTHA